MAKADYAMLLKDVAISDSNARSHNVELVETVLTIGVSTGIHNTHPEAMTNDNYYDLQGRRMDSLI